jgi:hypothetical protein
MGPSQNVGGQKDETASSGGTNQGRTFLYFVTSWKITPKSQNSVSFKTHISKHTWFKDFDVSTETRIQGFLFQF